MCDKPIFSGQGKWSHFFYLLSLVALASSLSNVLASRMLTLHTHSLSLQSLLFIYLTICTLCSFVVAPLIYWYGIEKVPLQLLLPTKPLSYHTICLSIGLLLSVCGINAWVLPWNMTLQFPTPLESWAQQVEKSIQHSIQIVTSFSHLGGLGVGIIVIAILPAVGEEFFFRGVLQNLLHRKTKNIHLSIGISALLFSLVHLRLYCFVPILLLGVTLGYIYWWTKDIRFSILAHCLNNTLFLGLCAIYQMDGKVYIPQSIPPPSWVVLLSFILMAASMATVLQRHEK